MKIESYGSLFDTQEKRDASFPHILQLIDSQGWKIVQNILDSNIEFHREVLETTDFDELRKVADVQNVINIFRMLSTLPQQLVELCSPEDAPSPSYDGDPYATVEEETQQQETKEVTA